MLANLLIIVRRLESKENVINLPESVLWIMLLAKCSNTVPSYVNFSEAKLISSFEFKRPGSSYFKLELINELN